MSSVKVFQVPPKLITGIGSSRKVGTEIKKLNLQKVLIVTDKVMSEVGILDRIKKSLSESSIEFTVFDQVSTEPTTEFVENGLKSYKENDCDLVLAVGGGSPIDTAKAISVMVTNDGSIQDYEGLDKIPKKGVPLVAIPTTAGTGSEATIFTIITDAQRDVKMLIGDPYIMPNISIVDAELTFTMPQELTAATGVDALTHAIEAYVSLKAQPLSDIMALSAIKLISGNLRQSWANGNNTEAREKTMMGALQAGIAFCNSSVALVHGMSRPIGAYFHIPHGVSNAVLLGTVTDFSLIGNPSRYADIARAMGENVEGLTDMEGAKLAAKAIKSLIKDVQIPSLSELKVEKEKFEKLAPQMATDSIASGSPANNPRKATKEEIIELYKLAY